MHMIRLRREFGFNSDTLKLKATLGECAIQFHDYSEAIVVSMVFLEFQATELASDSDVRAMARLSFMFTVGMIDIEADGVGSGDINADAEDPAYGNLNRDVEADGNVRRMCDSVPRLQ
ncbi:Adhesion G-Protein Coupled Receptor V1 [Manis pentadactyla]|nr:Adhesion G-Protein Coupled Receptor V1 [Manis pentadactyla]